MLGPSRATSWKSVHRLTSSDSHGGRNIGEAQVARLIGHTNADVTINVYSQVLDVSLRTAVHRVGGELFTIVHETETGLELSRRFDWLAALDGFLNWLISEEAA